MNITTLRKRAEFQRVRGGGRHSCQAFVLEGKPRAGDAGGQGTARFGFTVTKKLGGAVVRNRIRRRLKAAIVQVAESQADARYDYVVVAREAALVRSFMDLTADMTAAFRRVHSSGHRGGTGSRSGAGGRYAPTPGSGHS